MDNNQDQLGGRRRRRSGSRGRRRRRSGSKGRRRKRSGDRRRDDSIDMSEVNQMIEKLEKEIETLALNVPNPPLDSVPEGEDEESNLVVKTHGEKPKFDFEPKDHIELGKTLDIIENGGIVLSYEEITGDKDLIYFKNNYFTKP